MKNPALNSKHQLVCRQPTRTKQGLAAETDINRIAAQFIRTGQLPVRPPAQYGDATAVPSLTQVLAYQARAASLYGQLPQQVRDETGNDPARLEAWLRDSRNVLVAEKFGLLKMRPTPPPPQPKPVDQAEPPAPPKEAPKPS